MHGSYAFVERQWQLVKDIFRDEARQPRGLSGGVYICFATYVTKLSRKHLHSSPLRDLKLAVHKAQSLVPVLSTVAVVSRGVAAIAAVRIGSIAVGLDLAIVRAASLSSWARRELHNASVSQQDIRHTKERIWNILHQLCRYRRCTALRLRSVGRP